MVRADIAIVTTVLLIVLAIALMLWRRTRVLEEKLAAATKTAATLKKEHKEAHTTQSALLSAFSHDFRQPIHVAQLYLHNIRSQLANNHDRDDMLRKLARVEILMRDTHRLVDDVVQTNRLESAAALVQRTKVNLTTLCNDLVSNTQELAGHDALRISYYQSSPKPIWVYSDRGLIERLLRNLLVNAHRHANASHIRVRVWESAKRIAISIADDGQGIPADRLSQARKILDATRYTVSSDGRYGFGFGLQNVRKLSALIGGSVRVTSLKGRGTGFMLSLSASIKVSEKDISDVPTSSVSPSGLIVLCIGSMPESVRVMLDESHARTIYTKSIPAVASLLAEMRALPTFVVVAESTAKHQNIYEELENEFAQEIPIFVIQSSPDEGRYTWPHLALHGSDEEVSKQLRDALHIGTRS